jgi:hypothetical protein
MSRLQSLLRSAQRFRPRTPTYHNQVSLSDRPGSSGRGLVEFPGAKNQTMFANGEDNSGENSSKWQFFLPHPSNPDPNIVVAL